MNRYITKKTFIIINIIFFIIEVILVYLLAIAYLNNDHIKPDNLAFYEYLLDRFEDLV